MSHFAQSSECPASNDMLTSCMLSQCHPCEWWFARSERCLPRGSRHLNVFVSPRCSLYVVTDIDQNAPSRPPGKLDSYPLVHVLGQVEDCLSFWLVHGWLGATTTACSCTAPKASTRTTALWSPVQPGKTYGCKSDANVLCLPFRSLTGQVLNSGVR